MFGLLYTHRRSCIQGNSLLLPLRQTDGEADVSPFLKLGGIKLISQSPGSPFPNLPASPKIVFSSPPDPYIYHKIIGHECVNPAMGWMNRKSEMQSARPGEGFESVQRVPFKDDETPLASCIENTTDSFLLYKPVPTSTPDDELPFIKESTVSQATDSNLLWLVVGSIVYDCTHFAAEHPGGSDILQPFRGTDCSWQFWRFHSKDEMQEFGRPLRIGITKGVKNRFKERPRFVGLRKFWALDNQ